MAEKEESFLKKVNGTYVNTIGKYSNYIAEVTRYETKNKSKEAEMKKAKQIDEKEQDELEL